MPQYKTDIFRYALDVATQNKREDISGNALMIVRTSSEAALINIEVKGKDLQGSGSLPFQNRDELELPEMFDQMLLSWDAQPGQWIEILVITLDPAPEVFDYTRQERGTIDSIANTVMVLEQPSGSFQTYRPTVGTTGALILPADPLRKKVTLTNPSTGNGFFIANANVIADGHYIPPSASIDIDTTAEIWGYTSTGSISLTALVQY